jgi:hypothetical protein
MKETLEKAAENFYREYPTNPLDKPEWHYNRDVDCFKKRKAFINGAKYMAEKMYSEEEVKFIVSEALQSALVTVDLEQWFEQFKKK